MADPAQAGVELVLVDVGTVNTNHDAPHNAGAMTDPPAAIPPAGSTNNQDDNNNNNATGTDATGNDGDPPAGDAGTTPLGDNIQAVMGYVEGRMEQMKREKRERRKACLKKTGHISNIILAAIVAVVALFFGIYGLYHFSRPANDIALESLKAAEWSNYYNWVWTICPAEQEKNLTVPECDEAQRHAVAPPKRPDNFNLQQTMSYKLARRLVPLINGSYEFEMMLGKTDERCGVEGDLGNITVCSQYSPWPSTIPEPSSLAHKINRRTPNINVTFPLPSVKMRDTIVPPHFPLKLRLTSVGLSLFNPFLLCFYFYVFAGYKYRNFSLHLWNRKVFRLFNLFYIFWVLDPWGIMIWSRIMDLVTWMAQDEFLEKCLDLRGLNDPQAALCSHIASLSSQLSISDSAKVWGIWRGFYTGRIHAANLDGTVLKSLFVDLCCFLFPYYCLHWFLFKKWSSFRDFSVGWSRGVVVERRYTDVVRSESRVVEDEEQPLIDLSED
ncbi:hypothetical protein DL95DRAFT_395361 [Leptodontidium sp. 2 PMI_412]|nr:hypothetical protein DL95DRAFT_395361 [Leptodontidium sp. 2 PMI_412]